MKISVYCMNEDGNIVCALVTHNAETAKEYAARKNRQGFITITKKGE